jgi:hypothetical protein
MRSKGMSPFNGPSPTEIYETTVVSKYFATVIVCIVLTSSHDVSYLYRVFVEYVIPVIDSFSSLNVEGIILSNFHFKSEEVIYCFIPPGSRKLFIEVLRDSMKTSISFYTMSNDKYYYDYHGDTNAIQMSIFKDSRSNEVIFVEILNFVILKWIHERINQS